MLKLGKFCSREIDHRKPVIAFAGCVTDDAEECNGQGIDAFFPILRAPCTLDEAMNVENASANLTATVTQAMSLAKVFGDLK